MADGTLDIRDPEAAARSPLANAIFSIDGVSGVFFRLGFRLRHQGGGADWPQLKPAILGRHHGAL